MTDRVLQSPVWFLDSWINEASHRTTAGLLGMLRLNRLLGCLRTSTSLRRQFCRSLSYTPAAAHIEHGLAKLGHGAWKPLQREAINLLFERNQLVFVAPTGGGKSLVYQLPATLLPGTTIVVSPLISLMVDQVAALGRRNVPATYLASSLTQAEMNQRTAMISNGAYKLVYVSPERLAHESFRRLLRQIECPLLVVDEAHCISSWGHDFRPEYTRIPEVLRYFDQEDPPRVLACTATATASVREDILSSLELPSHTAQLLGGFGRPNIALHMQFVQGTGSKRRRTDLIDFWLNKVLGASSTSGTNASSGMGIVFASTRKDAETEAARLSTAGWVTGVYHAGLGAQQRKLAGEAFMAGELEVKYVQRCYLAHSTTRIHTLAVFHIYSD